MSDDVRGAVPDEMDGLSTEEAVEQVLDRDGALDRDGIRKRIEYVTHDGVVCRDGVEDGLRRASEIVATPENRIDLARREFENAVELAEPVADLRIVAARLEEFEERLMALKEEVDSLGPELNRLFNEWLEEPDDVYAMADGLYQHADRGRQMQGLVDELIQDVESFQQWVQDGTVRAEELERDLEGVGESLDDLERAVAGLGGEEDANASGDGEEDGPEPALVWVDAALRHRLVDLLIDDLETELDGLRAWPEPDDTDDGEWERLANRIAAARNRWETLEDEVEAAAHPEWRERFDDRLAAFESDLDGVEPPVDWGAVQQALQEHRAEISPGRRERQ